MSERKRYLLPIAAGAAAIGVIGGIAAYFYFNNFNGIPPRDAGDVVSSAKVIPDEAWIVGLLSTAPKTWAQLEKLGNSQFNKVPLVGLLLRETNSVAGIPPFIPQSLGTPGTPKPRQLISQRMRPLTRSTISQRMRPLARSTRNRMQECNGGFSYGGKIIVPRSPIS